MNVYQFYQNIYCMHTSVKKREAYDLSEHKIWVNLFIKDVERYRSRVKEIHVSNSNLSVDDICTHIYKELEKNIRNYFSSTDIDQDIIETECLRAKTLCCVLRRWVVEEICKKR